MKPFLFVTMNVVTTIHNYGGCCSFSRNMEGAKEKLWKARNTAYGTGEYILDIRYHWFMGTLFAHLTFWWTVPIMAELVMRCNNLQCRLELLDKAVVTTCRYVMIRLSSTSTYGFSHLFCLRCAKEGGLFRQHHAERTCPACGTELPKSDDCVATALNPSEDYKSSILAGLSPSIIMDCATRALSFYSYQAMNAV